MKTSPATYAPLMTTLGRITVMTKLWQAQTIAEMDDRWKHGYSSAFTDETPAEIFHDLTGTQGEIQSDMSDTRSARTWITDRVQVIEPFLTHALINHAHLISRDVVKRAPAEFEALESAWKRGIIGLHAGHLAMERAAAVYPKLFPGRQITFLADRLMELSAGIALLHDASRLSPMPGAGEKTIAELYRDAFKTLRPALHSIGKFATLQDHHKIYSPSDLFTLVPGIKDTLDDRFRFIANHVRDVRVLKERFGLTEELVERAVAAGLLSANPFQAVRRYSRKRTWLNIQLGASLALVAGLVAGGFISHARDAEILRNLLWIFAWAPGMGFSAVAYDRRTKHQHSELVPN